MNTKNVGIEKKRLQKKIRDTIADNLDDLTKIKKAEEGCTAKNIAEKIGISPGTFSKYLNAKNDPEPLSILLMAKYFGVSADFLLGLTNAKSIVPDVRQIVDYTGLSEEVVDYLHRNHIASKSSNVIEPNAINDMLGQLLNSSFDSLTLRKSILRMATRLAVKEIAEDIASNPSTYVPQNDFAKEILSVAQEILNSHVAGFDELSEDSKDQKTEEYNNDCFAFTVQKITDFVITNYTQINGNEEFDRFEATQDYIKAYDYVLNKEPDEKYLKQRKQILLGWLGLNINWDEVQSGE